MRWLAPLGYLHLDGVGSRRTPAEAGDMELGAPARSVAVGGVLADRHVRCWGMNNSGELGYEHTDPVGQDTTPASAGDVDVGGGVTQISVGDNPRAFGSKAGRSVVGAAPQKAASATERQQYSLHGREITISVSTSTATFCSCAGTSTACSHGRQCSSA